MAQQRPAVVLREIPVLRAPRLVAAFSGWPDAGEVATGALRYLVNALNARRIGHIDAMPYLDMTVMRPLTVVEDGKIQTLRFPVNDLYAWHNRSGEPDLLLLAGIEPHVGWMAFLDDIREIVKVFDVRCVYSLGSLFDAVVHTRPPRVSGVGSSAELRAWMRQADIQMTDYQGPSSVHTALSMACREMQVDAISLWGHAPHYVRTPANPKVCRAMLERLALLLGIELNLDDLHTAGVTLDEALARLVDQNPELREHIEQLEAQAASRGAGSGEPDGADWPVSTESLIRDVEAFLRREQSPGDETPPTE